MPAETQLRLAVEAPEGPGTEAHVIALRNWLVSEDALRGRVRPHRQSPPPGHMGSTVELLTVALGSGGVLAVLIQSVCSWLTSRGTDIKIAVSTEDGRRIEVDVQRAADPQALLREVAERFPAAGEQSR
ncbi:MULTISPECIES: effector-associated constant component EACC1 [unclassified Streptomyces]|uniref:effector-associated constant component EACC1 n=1 Tax=unclassified Streptomyces TaxID=2593676 RepID=UPI002E18031A|nr:MULTISPECIES: hypothetical protein [unclassified Streptomyces]